MKANGLAQTHFFTLLKAEIGDINEKSSAVATRDRLAATYAEFTEALETLALESESLSHQLRCLYYVRIELHALQRECYEVKKKSACM